MLSKFKIGDYIVNKDCKPTNKRVWCVESVINLSDGYSYYSLKSICHPRYYFHNGDCYKFGVEFIEPRYDLLKDVVDLVTMVL